MKHLGTPQAIEMMHCMVNVGFVYVQSPSSELYLHCTFYSPGNPITCLIIFTQNNYSKLPPISVHYYCPCCTLTLGDNAKAE